MEVVRWTKWSNEHYDDIESREEIEDCSKVVIKELRRKNYHFGGIYHQNGEFGVPVLSNGKYFQVTQRVWGEIMAKAFPEEFENSNDPFNYVAWYLEPADKHKNKYPEQWY